MVTKKLSKKKSEPISGSEKETSKVEKKGVKNQDLKKQYFLIPKKLFYIGVLILIFISFMLFFYLNKPLDCDVNLQGEENVSIFQNKLNTSINSSIVAIINNKELTRADFDKNIDIFLFSQGIPESYKNQISEDDLLNQTIILNLLYDSAVNNGFNLDKKIVENSLEASLMKSGSNLDTFKKNFENKSFTYNDLVDFYTKQKTIASYLNASTYDKIIITNEDVLSYYQSNHNQFNISEEIRASHILVNTSSEAINIISKLDNGANFSKLAKENSIGPSASNGGDLGYFGKGMMVREFEDAAFNLTKIGEYTKVPIKTKYGYHIIELTGKHDAKVLSFDEVKTEINSQLFKEKQQQEFSKVITEILKNSDIKIIN